MIESVYTLRESHLEASVNLFRPVFDKIGFPLPEKLRLSCGKCKGSKVLGNCYPAAASEDGVPVIYIDHQTADTSTMMGILVHELGHAATPGAGHKGEFKKFAGKVGLEGPMKHTKVGSKLQKTIDGFIKEVGIYPHAVVTDAKTSKRNKNRQLKVICPNCSLIMRATRGAMDESGFPFHCGPDGSAEEIAENAMRFDDAELGGEE